MACDIVFRIAGKEVRIDNTNITKDNNSLIDIANVLIENPGKKAEIYNLIHELKSRGSHYLTKEDLLREGLVGNLSLNKLMEEYPKTAWPADLNLDADELNSQQSSRYEPNILLVKDFNYNGINLKGRIVDKNGKELFIVRSNSDDLNRFAAYLKTRDAVLNSSIEDDDELNVIFPLVQKKLKDEAPKNIKDMVLDYLNNSSMYDFTVKDSNGNVRDVLKILNDTARTICEYAPRRYYNDQFIDSITQRLVRNKKNSYININKFLDLLNKFHPDWVEKIAATVATNFKSEDEKVLAETTTALKNKSTRLAKLTSLLKNNPTELESIVRQYFLDVEPELDLEIEDINNRNIVFKTIPKTLDTRYGFTYDTINNMVYMVNVNGDWSSDQQNKDFDEKDCLYKGYYIYAYPDSKDLDEEGKPKVKYLYDRNVLTVKSYSRLVNSIDEAKANIDRKIQISDKLLKTSNIWFKFTDGLGQHPIMTKTKAYYAEGSFVKSLDVDIPSGTVLPEYEQELIENKYLQDFYDYIKTLVPEELVQPVLSTIDDTEKAVTFLYLLRSDSVTGTANGNILRNKEWSYYEKAKDVISSILKNINDAKYVYYYIQQTTFPTKQKEYYVRTIKYNERISIDFDDEYKNVTPVLKQLQDIVDYLANKFGVKAEILKPSEVDSMGQQFANAKAFIKDGKIYINGGLATKTDVLHEYTHLLLGVLKARNYDVYTTLLNNVMSSGRRTITTKLRTFPNKYPNLAKQDLYEEIFAQAFAEYLSGRQPDDIFASTQKAVNSTMKNIFNLAKSSDLDTAYNSQLYSLFSRFNTDIGQVLSQGNGLEFEKGRFYRQAANWIAKQIEENKIIQQC